MYELTQADVKKNDPDTAIIAVGSIEQHGDHLPVGTDYYIADAFAKRLGDSMNAFRLPCLPISTCREHMGMKGSVWMDPDIFYRMMISICSSLKEQGFRRIIIIQGHGGIFVMTPVVRELNATNNPALMVCKAEPYAFTEDFINEGIMESDNNLHAGEFETSIMLYLYPELVKSEKIVDFIPSISRPYLNYGSLLCASPAGVWGKPSLGSREKGELILSFGTKLLKNHVQEVFSYMENKKTVGYSKF